MTVFPFEPDWAEGVRESVGYPTDVLVSQDGSEQRIGLRERPTRRISFTVAELDGRATAAAGALLWSGLGGVWLVPLWMDVVPLASDVEPGVALIPCDPDGMGDTVLLWRSPFLWEVVSVAGAGPSGLVPASRVTREWPARGTLVIPARQGRITDDLTLARPGTDEGRIAVDFTLEDSPYPVTYVITYDSDGDLAFAPAGTEVGVVTTYEDGWYRIESSSDAPKRLVRLPETPEHTLEVYA